jgi:hypothetical protein
MTDSPDIQGKIGKSASKFCSVVHCALGGWLSLSTHIRRCLALWTLLAGPVWAFDAPVGWTKQSEVMAMLDPAEPGRGLVFQYQMTGGSGDPDEIKALLQASGYQPKRAKKDNRGYVNLHIGQMLGRAKYWTSGDAGMWAVVIVSLEHASTLDPDALLTSMMPTPETLDWGATAESLPGGTDGSPWGSGNAAALGANWTDATKVEPWAHDQDLVGLWTGSAMIRGAPQVLHFRFEVGGQVNLEKKVGGEVETHAGTWTTRKNTIRMEIPGGDMANEYRVLGSTLTMRFDGAELNLRKQQSVQ